MHTVHSFRAFRPEYRNPVRARFSSLVETGPGAHPASYTMGTGCLSAAEKRPGYGVNHPPPSKDEVKERVELYLYSLWAFTAGSKVTFTSTLSLPRFLHDSYHSKKQHFPTN